MDGTAVDGDGGAGQFGRCNGRTDERFFGRKPATQNSDRCAGAGAGCHHDGGDAGIVCKYRTRGHAVRVDFNAVVPDRVERDFSTADFGTHVVKGFPAKGDDR